MNAQTGLKRIIHPPVALSAQPVLACEGLRVETAQGVPIVEDIALRLNRGDVLGLVGESGSGKSTVARALLGYGQNGARVTQGRLEIEGETIDLGDERATRRIRGRLIAYVPQNPATALNPTMRIGDIVAEMAVGHGRRRPSSGAIGDVMSAVGLPRTQGFLARYPHQLSGGQVQRVAIAVILIARPAVVVLDEPTSGLDVLSQAQVLAELERLRAEFGLSIVCVSHDLAVLSQVADRIAVMYGGRIVEEGSAAAVLGWPAHPYTQGLIASIPEHLHPRDLAGIPGAAASLAQRPAGCAFAPRCALKQARCETARPPLADITDGHKAACLLMGVALPVRLPLRVTPEPRADARPVLGVTDLSVSHRGVAQKAVDGAGLAIGRGRCLAVVGASGSGKTTIARAVVGLQPFESGTILLDGDALAPPAHGRTVEQRRRIQLIPQDSSDALNPRQNVEQAIARPLRLFHGLRGEEARGEIRRLLALVRLDPAVVDRYPAALSGGERQRVSIARALAARPDILVCDEITSALDVSVQAAILTLLQELRAETGVSMLFISHDLGVVSALADDILVLHGGRVVETGPAAQILTHPRSDHAKALLAAAPRLRHRAAAVRPEKGAIPFPAKLSAGA